jgi:hypothetical protein
VTPIRATEILSIFQICTQEDVSDVQEDEEVIYWSVKTDISRLKVALDCYSPYAGDVKYHSQHRIADVQGP